MATKLNIVDESRSPTKTILLLAWPVLIEQVFSTLVGYADTAMVGSLGAAATTSVSISMSVIMLLNGFVMSLGMGITTMVARSAGAGDYEKARAFMRHAILVILYVGLPIALVIIGLHRLIPQWLGAEPEVLELAAEYNIITGVGRIFGISSMILNSAFRGYGDTKTPLRINTTMNVVNVIFNFLLIYPTRTLTIFGASFTMWGAGWGVNGAAVATSIGMAVAGLQGLHVAFFRDNEFRIDFKGPWKIDWVLMRQVFHISLPAMVQRVCMSASGIIITKSVATLGTVTLAARTLCDSAESIAVMPAFAFQTATTTLVASPWAPASPIWQRSMSSALPSSPPLSWSLAPSDFISGPGPLSASSLLMRRSSPCRWSVCTSSPLCRCPRPWAGCSPVPFRVRETPGSSSASPCLPTGASAAWAV